MPVALPVAFLLLSLLAAFSRGCIPTETPDYIYDQEWLEQERERMATTSVLLTTVSETTAPTTSPSSAAPTTTTSATTTPTATSTTSSTTTSTTTSTTIPHACPTMPTATWKFNANNGHCYYASTSSETWQAAEANCQSYGGTDAHLASISDQQENDFIFNMVTTINDFHWLGLQQLGNMNTFSTTGTWTDNTMYDYPSGYSNWFTSLMMNMNDVCAYIVGPFGGASDSKWSYTLCSVDLHYVCEVPATL